MKTPYRNSLLVTAIAMLMTAPGWTVAEEAPPPHPESGLYRQPMNEPGSGVDSNTAPAQGVPPEMQSPSAQTTPDKSPLFAKTPGDLDKMDVIGVDGQELGEISKVVRGRLDSDIYAVIASGGILGYGGQDVVVPLTELQLKGDKLQIAATEDELKSKMEYTPEQYVDLQPPSRPIGEFSAFESGTPNGGDPMLSPQGSE